MTNAYRYEYEKGLKHRNAETQSLKNAVSDLLELYRMKGKFNELQIKEAWMKLLGESVARRTKELYIRNRKMFIRLESAALKNELMMAKSKILEKLNQSVGEECINDLIFL